MRRIQSYGPSLIVLTTAVVVLAAGPAAVRRIGHAYTDARIIEASQRLDDNPILEQINQAYRDIATMVEPSVVHISTETPIEDRFGGRGLKSSSGSGWIYDDQGHVVTNYHVVEDARRIEVQLFNGEIRTAEVIGGDAKTDIAVLKIPPGQLHPASRTDPAQWQVDQGDLVFAFGSPFDFRFSMSSGVVSGKGRSVGVIQDGYENFIQVDAAINPGNSGGPLTDHRGRVIGMNTAIATGRRTPGSLDDGQFAGIGLAIPIEMIEPVVSQLITRGFVDKAFLGLHVVDRGNTIGDELGLLEYAGPGLLVPTLDQDNPGWRAGLRPGDVITHLDGERLVTRSDLVSRATAVAIDGSLLLDVARFDPDRQRVESQRIEVPGFAAPQLRELPLLQFDDTIGQILDIWGFTGRGVRVARLDPHGPAHAAGVRRGDIITEVDGRTMATVQQLRSVISSMLPGRTATLTIWRYDAARDVAEQLEIDVDLVRLDTLRLDGRLPPDQSEEQIVELGIAGMATSTPELAARYGAAFHPGVIVTELVEGSELGRAIVPGTTIVEIAEQPIDSAGELIETLRQYDLRPLPGLGVRVTVISPEGQVRRTYLRNEQR